MPTLGLDCKMYHNTNTPLSESNVASPTWTEAGNLKDLTLNLSKAEADVTTRSNSGWRANVGTLKEGELSFDMLYETSDAFYTAVYEAWRDGTELHVAAAYGDIDESGVEYFEMVVAVIGFEEQQPLEDAVTVSVTLKPTVNTYGSGGTNFAPRKVTSSGTTTTT